MRQEYQSVPNISTPSGETNGDKSSNEYKKTYERKLNPSDIKVPP